VILVVNADDFGMSAGVNHGIIQAHQTGIVTSTSLMVRGAAVAEAVSLARENPRLGVGLHVDLGEWVYRDDQWQVAYSVVPTDDADAVAAEVGKQLDAFRALMQCEPTHFDSHQHVHRERPVRRILGELTRKLGIPLRHFHPRIAYCGKFYGQSDKGYANHEAIQVESLLQIIRTLPEGVTELACHPASTADTGSTYEAERILELQSLCDPRVRAALSEAGVELQSFRAMRTDPSALRTREM
jgi:predicted glycoside hydrolase/deacetylase ChbG (UPF0249 family)